MQKEKSSKQIKVGAIISYIAIAFNILSGLIYTPWMLRCIGQSNYGLYSTALAFVSYFTVDFGLSSAITRFVSKYRAEGKEEEIKKLLGVIYKLYLLIDAVILVCLAVCFCFLNQIFLKFTPEELEKFRLVYVIMGAFTLFSFPCTTFSGILTAYERFAVQKISGLVGKIAIVVLMVIFLSLGYGLYALVLVNVIVHLLVHVFRLCYLKRKIHLKISWKGFDFKLLKEVFSFSVWMLVITLAERFVFNIEPTIIGSLAGTVAVSVFAVANTIEGYVWTFATALNNLFLPKVFRLSTEDAGDRTRINALLQRVGRIQMLVIGLILFVFVSLGYEFVFLWLGDGYQVAYYIAVLMIMPSYILRTLDIAGSLSWAENKLKERTLAYGATALINVVLSLVLVPKFGAIGAGISIFIGMIAGHVIIGHIIYTRVLHLDMWGLYKNCQLKMIVPGVICMAAGFALQHYFPSPNLLHFVLKACVAGGVYVVAVWLLYMNAYEKELFTGAFRKVKKKLIKK